MVWCQPIAISEAWFLVATTAGSFLNKQTKLSYLETPSQYLKIGDRIFLMTSLNSKFALSTIWKKVNANDARFTKLCIFCSAANIADTLLSACDINHVKNWK